MLTVRPREGHGRGQAVFGEDAVAVEIILPVFGVVPSAHEPVVGAGVLEDGRDALLVETVLRGSIGDHNPFLRLTHGLQVDGEPVRVHLPHGPDGVAQFFVGEIYLPEGGNCEKQHENGKNRLFHTLVFIWTLQI